MLKVSTLLSASVLLLTFGAFTRLGVSRYTVYKYLDELSGEDGPEGPL